VKKCLIVMVFLFISCCLFACASKPIQQTERPAETTCGGWPPPPQPMTFSGIDEAVAYITKEGWDDQSYRDEEYFAYKKMNDYFLKDGYYFSVISNFEGISANKTKPVTLYPEVDGEDAGICYWLEKENVNYQILIYHTRNDYKADVEKSGNGRAWMEYESDWTGTAITDEEDARLSDHRIIETAGNSTFKTAHFLYNDGMKRYQFYAMIDECHYVRVWVCLDKSEKNEKEAIAFFNSLRFEKVSIPTTTTFHSLESFAEFLDLESKSDTEIEDFLREHNCTNIPSRDKLLAIICDIKSETQFLWNDALPLKQVRFLNNWEKIVFDFEMSESRYEINAVTIWRYVDTEEEIISNALRTEVEEYHKKIIKYSKSKTLEIDKMVNDEQAELELNVIGGGGECQIFCGYLLDRGITKVKVEVVEIGSKSKIDKICNGFCFVTLEEMLLK